MERFLEAEERCVEHIEVDYMPLNDIVREFSGFEEYPKEQEFLEALEFLKYLIKKYRLKSLEGPEMTSIDKSPEELVDWLKEKWFSNQYDDISYKIWFDK